ncbi:hypothetical protein [Holophaga foetida]|uniref:hypothetical protein n=1 Tax=Holophaga foetida TaxID=35839 RepID=UPI0002472F1D|nr:hypothetical protein [Holophaga foetida]
MRLLRVLSVLLALVPLFGVVGSSSASLLAQGPPVVLKTARTIETVVRGAFIVADGGSLTLSGVAFGNITVEKGGSLVVRGSVHGDVINQGGEVKILGRVTGSVIKKGGNTVVDPQASVEGGAPLERGLRERADGTPARTPTGRL